MKFTLSWLKTHLNTDADLPTILKGLTNIGLEVEGVENPAEKLGAFRIAKVLTAERPVRPGGNGQDGGLGSPFSQ